MDWFGGSDYELARQVLQRGTAAIFLIAFASTFNQFPALLGERGLLPVPEFLRTAYGRSQPTIFRLHYSDRMLRALCVIGILISASLVSGLPQLLGPWAPMVAFLLLWVGYLSIVNVGQTFYGFGWESLLLEAGFLVAFLGSNELAPPIVVLFLLRWLVFRLEFGAGMIKMHGDRSWRDLTALYYHHETQPMPNPVSRFAHLLPIWMHRGEVLGNHVKLLDADPATLRLLRHDPFDGVKPEWIRAELWLYRFATRQQRRETGLWWVREEAGTFARPARLQR